jgi:hypothetical protein
LCLTAATLRLCRRGEAQKESAWRFARVQDALLSARALVTRGVRPRDLAVAGLTMSVVLEGPAPVVAAAYAFAAELAEARGGQLVPNAPLPLITRPPHERTVALHAIEGALPPPAGRVIGWSHDGAAVIDPDRAVAPPEAPGAFFAALKQRLDGNSTFPAWPASKVNT